MANTPPQAITSLESLAQALDAFAVDRDWTQFHAPKNLVMALTGEVGELSEVFQWRSERDSFLEPGSPDWARAREELADVLLYTVRLAHVLHIELLDAARAKLDINARKYPVAKAKGRSDKYTEL